MGERKEVNRMGGGEGGEWRSSEELNGGEGGGMG